MNRPRIVNSDFPYWIRGLAFQRPTHPRGYSRSRSDGSHHILRRLTFRLILPKRLHRHRSQNQSGPRPCIRCSDAEWDFAQGQIIPLDFFKFSCVFCRRWMQ
ncbi:hypothetical protein B0H17DRAFT_1032172 [Mycena rosella]|uniref:Uncharacterized protein n=1 Tax=Mycena rosella TaxID=1033263 RepID=A0AAD7GZ94_MYCRO|nr:hypothetical protein B0H17DRAFT_1032172 [Mycena rosella]